MKKHFLFFLIAMSVSLAAVSQEDSTTVYRSIFGDSVTTWEGDVYVMFYDWGLYAAPFLMELYSDDTTTVDGLQYYVLVQHNTDNRYYEKYDWYSDYGLNTSTTYYIREDSTHSKLYVWYSPDVLHTNNEILVMDLDLEVGDTMDMSTWRDCGLFGDREIPYVIIDSIFTHQGRKVLQTNIYPSNRELHSYPTFFIEGAGPTTGLAYFLYVMSNGYETTQYVNCNTKDNGDHYWLLGEEGCENHLSCSVKWIIQGFENIDKESVNISPNPTNGRLGICGMPEGEKKIRVVSMTGKTVMELRTAESEMSIDLSDFQKGIYIVEVVGYRISTTKKIIKL